MLIVIFGDFPIGWPNLPGIAGKGIPNPLRKRLWTEEDDGLFIH